MLLPNHAEGAQSFQPCCRFRVQSLAAPGGRRQSNSHLVGAAGCSSPQRGAGTSGRSCRPCGCGFSPAPRCRDHATPRWEDQNGRPRDWPGDHDTHQPIRKHTAAFVQLSGAARGRPPSGCSSSGSPIASQASRSEHQGCNCLCAKSLRPGAPKAFNDLRA